MSINYNIDSFTLNTTLEVSSLVNRIQVNDNFGTLEVNIDREEGMRKHLLKVYVCYHTTYGRRRPMIAYIPILTSKQREQAATRVVQVIAGYIAKHAARKMLRMVTPVTAMYDPVIMSRDIKLHSLNDYSYAPDYISIYEAAYPEHCDREEIRALNDVIEAGEIGSIPSNIMPISTFGCDTYVEL